MEITKHGKKLFVGHPGQFEPREVSRVWAGVVWPGELPGYVVVGAQAKKDGRLFLIAEHQDDDWQGLSRACAALARSHQVSRFIHEGGVVANAYRDRAMRLVREEHLVGRHETAGHLVFSDAPYPDAPAFAVGLAKGWLEGKRVIADSSLRVFTSQLHAVSALRPDGVLEAMVGELYAFKSLVHLVSAMDLQRAEAKAAQPKAYIEPSDERTGI